MKNGKVFTHKKKSLFEQAQENQDIKKEASASFFVSYLLAR